MLKCRASQKLPCTVQYNLHLSFFYSKLQWTSTLAIIHTTHVFIIIMAEIYSNTAGLKGLTPNIPSLARQRCLPSWGPRRTPFFFFFVCNFSTVWFGRLLILCFLGFWDYNSVIQALLASNILCLFISTEVTRGTELLHTHSSLIQRLNNVIFWALSACHFSNLQSSEPKNNTNNNIPHF